MDNYDLLQQLETEMHNVACDAKLESQLVLALEKGLSVDDFMVNCDRLFYREYNRDLMSTEVKEDPRKQSILQLHLTRSGVYDHLPEGLFHDPGEANSKMFTASDMTLDHQRNKKIEQEVRRFFLPFENDCFLQRIQLEIEETTLLKGLQSGILNDYFIKFWNIPASIPKRFIVPLILLLPYASKIAGNIELTALCLEQLLQETVRVKKRTAISSPTQSPFSQALGKHCLGVDLICGDQFVEDYPVLEFTIGPLQHSEVTDYLEGGANFTFLETFYNFFVAVGVDHPTNIEVKKEKRNFQLHHGNEPVLGFTSVL